MFARIAVAFLAVSSALAAPFHGHVRRGYLKDAHKLEPYDQFETRFDDLGCSHEKDNVDFYNTCCHPLLKGQSLSSRPDYCDPNSAYYDDCHDTTTPTPPTKPISTTRSSSSSAKPTAPPVYSTPKPSNTKTPTSSANGGGGGGTWNEKGVATYFKQDGHAGACGTVHQDSDFIAAMDSGLYEKSNLCGKQVKIVRVSDNNSVVVTVADECPTCENNNSIDLSVAAFEALAGSDGLNIGQFPIKWEYVS